MGISITGGVRVGNELGAGNPRQAKRAAFVSIGIVGELIKLQRESIPIIVFIDFSLVSVSFYR